MKEKKGRELKCTTCHSQIVVGRHVEVTYDSCYLCHFKNYGSGRDLQTLGGCLGCHQLPEKDFVIDKITYNHKEFVEKKGVSCENCHIDVVQGDGLAPHDRCFTCHNQPEKLAQTKDVTFLHENHVTKHNVACFHCHQEIRHGFSNRLNGKSSKVALSVSDKENKRKEEDYKPSVKCKNCHHGTKRCPGICSNPYPKTCTDTAAIPPIESLPTNSGFRYFWQMLRYITN